MVIFEIPFPRISFLAFYQIRVAKSAVVWCLSGKSEAAAMLWWSLWVRDYELLMQCVARIHFVLALACLLSSISPAVHVAYPQQLGSHNMLNYEHTKVAATESQVPLIGLYQLLFLRSQMFQVPICLSKLELIQLCQDLVVNSLWFFKPSFQTSTSLAPPTTIWSVILRIIS